jgi:hypothetical protein
VNRRSSLSWPRWYLAQSLRSVTSLVEAGVDDEQLLQAWAACHDVNPERTNPPEIVHDVSGDVQLPDGAQRGTVRTGDGVQWVAALLPGGRLVRLVEGRMFRCSPSVADTFAPDVQHRSAG